MHGRWDFAGAFLEGRESEGLLRQLERIDEVDGPARIVIRGRSLVNLASNDYLGLRCDPRLAEGACRAASEWGSGSGSSRLVSGTTTLHECLESALASFHGTEAALTLSSGYAAGVGIVPALVPRDGHVYLDRLCHASLYDGARLSGARLRRYTHNDPGHLEDLLRKDSGSAGRKLVVTDTVFSMDGDTAPLAEIADICREHGALLLADEAHAVGVLGPGGRGLAAEAGLGEDDGLVMGTLGKAFGVCGAYVACTGRMRDYLINTCRSFIYSTAPPPQVTGALLAALEIVPGMDSRRRRLLEMAGSLRSLLGEKGIQTIGSTQIVPAVTGDVESAQELAGLLLDSGIFAPAIRPPTVPRGTARVRFSLSAALADEDFELLARVISSLPDDPGER